MQWHLSLAALIAATGIGIPDPPATSSEPTADAITTAETIALERERYQRFTVPVTIQGQGPFRFLIDTGAQATVLSHDLAAMLQLEDRRSATLVAMASSLPIETVGVQGLRLGSRTFYIQTAPLLAAEHIGGADGILGLDSLQDQRVLIDFIKQEIRVDDASELGGNRGFEIVVKARRRLGQLIITQANLDGVKTAVIVDTGAQSSVGNPALMRRLRKARVIGDSQMTDVNGQQLSGTALLARSLTVDRLALSNIPITFADSPPFQALGFADEPALILGVRELRLFRRVAIDFKSGRILFDLPRSVQEFDAFYGARLSI